MENSYLFLDKTHQRQVNKIKLPTGVRRTSFTYLENAQVIVRFSIDGENERSANKLSEIHENIIGYSPRVISCNSSAYYNQRLYPLVNSFERRLRELLYLATSGTDNDEAAATIEKIEEQALGELFENLFTDSTFIKNVKERINCQGEFKGKGRYTKKELQEYLLHLQENSIWDKLFGADQSSIIYKRSSEILKYRNSVMHAHNIGCEKYKNAKELFEEAIIELDKGIDKRIHKAEKEENYKETANEVLQSLLKATEYKNASNFANALGVLGDFSRALKMAELKSELALPSALMSIDAISRGYKGLDTLGVFGNINDSLESIKNYWTTEALLPEILNGYSVMQDILRNGAGLLPSSANTMSFGISNDNPKQTDEKN